MKPEGDATKLPKWAQSLIDALERNVEYWKNLATAGPDNSNTWIRRGMTDDESTPLGDSPNVTFRFGPGHMEYIACRIDGDCLYVHGGDALLIAPSGGVNTVRIRLDKRT